MIMMNQNSTHVYEDPCSCALSNYMSGIFWQPCMHFHHNSVLCLWGDKDWILYYANSGNPQHFCFPLKKDSSIPNPRKHILNTTLTPDKISVWVKCVHCLLMLQLKICGPTLGIIIVSSSFFHVTFFGGTPKKTRKCSEFPLTLMGVLAPCSCTVCSAHNWYACLAPPWS